MKILKVVILILGVGFIYTSTSHAQAWEATRKWDAAAENEYLRWIKKKATSDIFFNKTKILEGRIGVDCAKAAYALRAIFAYEHGLPFKVIGNEGRFIDAQSGSYTESDPNKRFIQFVARLVGDTTLDTLKYNTFPVAVTTAAVTPGVLYVFQMPGHGSEAAGRHTYIIRGVQVSGMIHFQYSTVPASPRLMTGHVQLPYYMPLNVDINNPWGFRRFLQPDDYALIEGPKRVLATHRSDSPEAQQAQDTLKSILGDRGYDPDDQNNIAAQVLEKLNSAVASLGHANPTPPVKSGVFLSDADDTPESLSAVSYYQQILIDRLAKGSPETLKAKLARDFFNLCSYAKERQSFVEEAYDYFYKRARIVSASAVFNRCPTESETYDYATPNRDSEFLDFVRGTKAWYLQNKQRIKNEAPNWYKINELIFNDGADFGSGPTIEMAEAKHLVKSIKLSEDGETCALPVDRHTGDAQSLVQLNIWTIIKALQEPDLMSSEPWVSVDRRWGIVRASAEERKRELTIDCQKTQ